MLIVCSAAFNVPLFRISRCIGNESREVFFETNTIHIRPDQILNLLCRHGPHVRQLHIEGKCAKTGMVMTEYFDAAETLMRCTSFAPKLRTVVWECKGLHETVRQLVQHLIKIIKFVRGEMSLSVDNFHCTDVGTYTLSIPNTPQVWRFSYTFLADLWDSWSRQERHFQLSYRDLEDYFNLRGAVRIPEWVYEVAESRVSEMRVHNLGGLAALVARYNTVETMLPLLKPQVAQLHVLRRFELLAGWRIKELALHGCLEFAGCVDLGNVRSHHGSNTLEWATELLAPNVRDFAAEFGVSIEDAEEYVRRCKSW